MFSSKTMMVVLTCIILPVCATKSLITDKTIEELTIEIVEPFDQANHLLTDLDQLIDSFVKKLSPINGSEVSTFKPTVEAKNAELEPSSKPTAAVASVIPDAKENNIGQLLDNLNDLDKKLTSTFQDLQTKRRYVLGAMIRQMQTTVRRIRTNVSRMQTQLASVETAATQIPLIARPILHVFNSSASTESPTVIIQGNKEIVEEIEEKINAVSKKISDIINRLNASLKVPNKDATNTETIDPIKTLNSIIHNHAKEQKFQVLSSS